MGQAMKRSIGILVREALLGNKDGLTLNQISAVIDRSQDLVSSALYRTYGFYISNWVLNENGCMGMVAVWSCVQVPANLPKPRVTEDMQAYQLEYRKKNAKKIKEARDARLAEMRLKAKQANAEIRAKHEADRAAAKARREAFRAEQARLKEEARLERARKKAERIAREAKKQEPEPAQYVPQKTRWVEVKPWSH